MEEALDGHSRLIPESSRVVRLDSRTAVDFLVRAGLIAPVKRDRGTHQVLEAGVNVETSLKSHVRMNQRNHLKLSVLCFSCASTRVLARSKTNSDLKPCPLGLVALGK